MLDYLNEKVAAKLIGKLYNNIEKGGELLVANFAVGTLERAYMDIFMDWKLIYRTEQDMITIAEKAGVDMHNVQLYRDPMCNVIYMSMKK